MSYGRNTYSLRYPVLAAHVQRPGEELSYWPWSRDSLLEAIARCALEEGAVYGTMFCCEIVRMESPEGHAGPFFDAGATNFVEFTFTDTGAPSAPTLPSPTLPSTEPSGT